MSAPGEADAGEEGERRRARDEAEVARQREHRPRAPAATPLTAATIGSGQSRIALTTAPVIA